MDNLVRTDTVFGKRVNMVGNISADLVLESLGKIYIKSRNKSQTLEELITSLVLEDPNASTSRVKIVEGIEGLDTSEFKDGTFVFDKLSNILYLFIDGELLELINVAPEGTGYVKRSGDTMTGRLAIYVKDGPPLYVNSAVLVPNLNAQYLNGETADTFTRRHRDEKISGSWTFKASTYFKSNIKAEKDIVINGSIGSPNFASGFGGYGWRMDADTNTLTVDNLVVRKLMKVYELVVNKISATNGSLWVSNAGKVVSVVKLDIKPYEFFSTSHADYSRYVAGLRMGDVLIKMPENPTLEDLDEEAFSTPSGDGIITRNCYSKTTLAGMQFIDVTADKPNLAENQGARFNPAFDPGFRFDCTFPIITRNDKQTYDAAYEQVQLCRDTLSELILEKASQADIESAEAALEAAQEDANPNKYVSLIRSYYKYFAGGDYYYVRFDDDNLPVFKAGDLLRCQKWTNGGIKYYDAVVCNYVGKGFIIQLAPSFLDKKTTIEYDNSLNPKVTVEEDSRNLDLYKSTRNYNEPDQENRVHNDDDTVTVFTYDEALDKSLMGMVEVDDSLVQMGHLWDKQRQNAVYITSTDDAAPYIDVLSGINRPDYSVNYHVPVYSTVKLFQHSYSLTTFTGYNNLVEIPYTGDYYIQDNSISNFTCEFVCFEHNNTIYLAKGKTLPSVQGVTFKYYLNIIPDKCTLLGEVTDNFYLDFEDGHILLEDGSGCLIQEQQYRNLTLESTRTVKARMGNLDGIQDEVFPIDKQPYGYGLYGQNVFLTGEFYLSNGQAVADLGKDSMAFAIAASREGNAAINLLRADLTRADNLLKASHYNKGTLKTAGMYIGNDSYGQPGIVIWGNKILFATTDAEFSGQVQPTMLLADGKIQGKYLGVNEAHSNILAPTLPTTEFTINGVTYTSLDTVRVFRQKHPKTGADYLEPGSNVQYVRKFHPSDNSSNVWLVVDTNGYPIATNKYGDVEQLTYVNFTYYNSEGTPTSYVNGILPNNVETSFLEEHTSPLKMWAFEIDGKTNIGGSTLYVDSNGKVVVTGILRSNEGNIGGLYLSKGGLFTYDTTRTYNPINLSTVDYGWGTESDPKFPTLSFKTGTNGSVTHTTNLNAKGLFYQVSTNPNGVNKWYDYLSLQVPALIFSMTIIPIIDEDDRHTFYARISTGLNAFQYVNMCYDRGGRYIINFDLMNFQTVEATQWAKECDWFTKQLILGHVHFTASAYNLSSCSFNLENRYSVLTPSKFEYNISDVQGYFRFNPQYMEDNQAITFRMATDEWEQSQTMKASIDQISFRSSNGYSFNPYLSNSLINAAHIYSYGAQMKATADRSYAGYYNEGGVWNLGSSTSLFKQGSWSNAISISTSDDESTNLGGFTLMCFYTPAFDTRYIEDASEQDIDYDPSIQEQEQQIAEIRSSLIATYGTNGTKYQELSNNLQSKVNDMTSAQESAQSSDISNISNNITSMGVQADSINAHVSYNDILNYQTMLQNTASSIQDAIDSLESQTSTVTPPSTSPDSDNTDNKYTVTGAGYHNNTSDAVSANDTSSIPVGKITNIDSSLSGVTPTVWAVYDIEGSNIINKSNVTLDPDNSEYIIKAIVNSNSTTSTRKARIFVTFDGGNHYGYVNVYQAAGSGSVTPTANTDMDTYLNVFKASSLSGESISVGSNVYDLLDYAFEAMKTKSGNLSYSNMMNGPVVDLSLASTTSDTIAAMKGWFLGLLLTSLYPFRGSVSGSNINNAILKDAMSTWGIDAWGDPDSSSAVSNAKSTINSYDVNTYTSKYKGMLMGAILYSVIYSDSTFLSKYKALKNTTYTSTFVQSYTHEGDDGDYTSDGNNGNYKHSIRGQQFFPYPPVNDTSSSSGIMGRDNTAWTSGKALRGQSEGTQAESDINDKFAYSLNALNIATGKSYASGSRAYTLLYNCHWSGNKTVNQIKNTTAYWRYRPAYAYNDTTVDSDTYKLAFGDGTNGPSTSYPSGHTGYHWGLAYVFAAIGGLTDSKIEDLFKRAYVYSQGRVIVGAHWQFCVEMGRLAASCMFAMLCANTKVMDDLYSIHSIS